MGIKNYDEQLAVIKSCEGQIAGLENYVRFLNSQIITLQSVWERNIDQQKVLETICHLIGDTDRAIRDYSYFESQALKYLNSMNTLEKIVHHPKAELRRGEEPLYRLDGNAVKRARIKVDIGLIEEQRAQISSYTGKLEQIYLQTKRINGQIDPLIIKQFTDKGGSSGQLASIAQDIRHIANSNARFAASLQRICEIYIQKENELSKVASQLSIKGSSSGQVTSQIQKSFTEYKTKVKKGTWPKAQAFTMYDFSNPDLYPKQSPKKCTLYANLYLMRRYAMMKGDENWINIDEKNCNSYTDKALWQGGMVDDYNFTVAGETVHVQQCSRSDKYMTDKAIPDMTPNEKRDYLRSVLEKHPEGVVAYDWDTASAGSGQHAILVTGYDETTGRFTVADPAGGVPGGVIDEGQSIVSLDKIESIWVINSN